MAAAQAASNPYLYPCLQVWVVLLMGPERRSEQPSDRKTRHTVKRIYGNSSTVYSIIGSRPSRFRLAGHVVMDRCASSFYFIF